MTAGERLQQLSGLSGATAAQHLLQIRQSGSTSGEMLVSRSGLSVATAAEHLLSDAGGLDVNYLVFAKRVGRR